MKSTCEQFFDAHAPLYEDNIFTKNTVVEVDFLLDELRLPPGSAILDVGCGTGRHTIELAKRGYAMTGLDLSSEMLAQAKESARKAHVHVDWVHSNATQFVFRRKFDAAIGLCEGSLGLLSQNDDPINQPLSILCNISRSLKPQAKVVLTVLNAALLIRKYQNTDVAEGRFDPFAMTESNVMSPRDGVPGMLIRERAFVPTELRLLCHLAGMTVLAMWGGTAGNWGRRPLDLDEIEFMVVARQSSEPLDIGLIGELSQFEM